jgi:hypothetical protein
MDPKVLSSIVVQSLQCINKTMVGCKRTKLSTTICEICSIP